MFFPKWLSRSNYEQAIEKCSGQVKTDSRLSRFLEIPVLLFKLSWGKISQIGMKTVAVIKHLKIDSMMSLRASSRVE
jgi:hypothetical protein